jgi:hypothetical protein
MKVKMSKYGSITLDEILENVAFIELNVPVFVVQELMTHDRIKNSINIGNVGKKMNFWYPEDWIIEGAKNIMPSDSARLNGELKRAYQSCLWAYYSLIRQGVPKSQAVSVLPVGIYIKCNISINCGVLHDIDSKDFTNPIAVAYLESMKLVISE